MEPFSIAAGVVGITAPTIQSIQQLRKSIQAIENVPKEIEILQEDHLTLQQAIASVQEIPENQWRALGDAILLQSKTGINLSRKSCTKFQTAIDHWTRHGDAGKLSWRDRTTIGLFKQDHIKSTSSQLRNCKLTLTSVVGIANLHHSLQQASANEEMLRLVATKESEISNAISTTQKQLNDMDAMLKALHLALLQEIEETPEQTGAMNQVETAKFALEQSVELLRALDKNIQSTATDIRRNHGHSIGTVDFGNDNHGIQAAIANAPIHFSHAYPAGSTSTDTVDVFTNKFDGLDVHEPSEHFLNAPDIQRPQSAQNDEAVYGVDPSKPLDEALIALCMMCEDLGKIRWSILSNWETFVN
ncbi:hypothetical protein FBEOM_5768 [Fusarium beomiforme]|uniref:Fungal N-terminal domain-containing protein n=1 Tax=Fusarium beomiforme TaxID=44412 RepID=A0A9P5DWS1_9HYPO|nr:hypothetical protein FBEOM_5768 [Fusarium beomiforme]